MANVVLLLLLLLLNGKCPVAVAVAVLVVGAVDKSLFDGCGGIVAAADDATNKDGIVDVVAVAAAAAFPLGANTQRHHRG